MRMVGREKLSAAQVSIALCVLLVVLALRTDRVVNILHLLEKFADRRHGRITLPDQAFRERKFNWSNISSRMSATGSSR